MVIAREETPCRCGRVKLDRVGSAVPVGFAAPGREHDAVGTALAAAQRYLHPDAAAIAAAGDSLTAFLSALRSPERSPTASAADHVVYCLRRRRRPDELHEQQLIGPRACRRDDRI